MCAGAKWYDFIVTSDSHVGSFTCDTPLPVVFKNGEAPSSMRTFFQYLETQHVADIKLANHMVQRVAGQAEVSASYTITSNEAAVFRVTQTFPASKAKPTLRNVAAMIPSSMLKISKHVRVVQNFQCPPRVQDWNQIGLITHHLHRKCARRRHCDIG